MRREEERANDALIRSPRRSRPTKERGGGRGPRRGKEGGQTLRLQCGSKHTSPKLIWSP